MKGLKLLIPPIYLVKVLKLLIPPIFTRLFSLAYKKFINKSQTKNISIEKNGEWYDKNTKSEFYVPYWDTHYYPAWSIIVDRLNKEKVNSILDVGCGSGQMYRLIKNYLHLVKYNGFDFSKKRIDIANEFNPEGKFFVENAYTTNLFNDCDYDVIICTEVLEHLEKDCDLMDRIPKGKKFFGTVPDYDSSSHVRYFENCEKVLERYEPYFSEISISELLINRKRSKINKLFIIEGIIK